MLLTYPPRVVLMVIALVLAGGYLLKRRFVRLTLVALFSLMLIYDLPWQVNLCPLVKHAAKTELTLLSFNTRNDVEHRGELAKFCQDNQVDLLSLQEISARQRQKFINAMPEYYFYWGDSSHQFEHADRRVFSCLIGIRKRLIADVDSVKVFTGITGYRTLALRCQLQISDPIPFQLINVHSTKPVTIRQGLKVFISDAASKAARHRQEKMHLDRWLNAQAPAASIIAGDFNAPANSFNLKFKHTTHAHRQSGNGPHLTFPRNFPVIGIDHIVGNSKITFTQYKIIDLGFSDHRAQLTKFEFKSAGQAARIKND